MEKELQKKCVDYAREIGLFVYSINPPNFKYMTYGTVKQLPDLHIVDYNAFFELKDAKYSKAHQDRQIKQFKVRTDLIKHGAKAYKVCKFEDFKKILEYLRKHMH